MSGGVASTARRLGTGTIEAKMISNGHSVKLFGPYLYARFMEGGRYRSRYIGKASDTVLRRRGRAWPRAWSPSRRASVPRLSSRIASLARSPVRRYLQAFFPAPARSSVVADVLCIDPLVHHGDEEDPGIAKPAGQERGIPVVRFSRLCGEPLRPDSRGVALQLLQNMSSQDVR